MLALRRDFAEFETLRMEFAAKFRASCEAKGIRVEESFGQVAGDPIADKVSTLQLTAFLAKHSISFESDKLEKLIKRLAGRKSEENGEAIANGSDAKITKDDFSRLIRVFYKVVKDIVVSDHLNIDKSGQIRRLEVGEVLEALQGPMLDTSVNCYRVQGKALKDGVVGWITVAGNQGITFLLPGGSNFKVCKPVPLTGDLKDLSGDSSLVQTLKESDLLEVIEWSRTSSSAMGVTRIRVRVLGGQATGWASVADSDGNKYLDVS